MLVVRGDGNNLEVLPDFIHFGHSQELGRSLLGIPKIEKHQHQSTCLHTNAMQQTLIVFEKIGSLLFEAKRMYDLPALRALHQRAGRIVRRLARLGLAQHHQLLPAIASTDDTASCVWQHRRQTLTCYARLFHATCRYKELIIRTTATLTSNTLTRTAKLFHVFAEMTITTIGALAGVALFASSPSPTRRVIQQLAGR